MNDKLTASTEIVVPFFDLDPMNVVWHGNYVKYFEVARCELLEKFGYGYQEMKNSGFQWPVIDLHLRYVKPAVMGQKITCIASLAEYENRLKINYLIINSQTQQRLTKGHSIQVAIDMKTNELQLVSPQILFDKIDTFYAGVQ